MIDSTTPAPAWARPAAPDRYPLNRPVAPPLCRSRGHRPASTVRPCGHAGRGINHLAGFGGVVAGELQEALHARLLATELLGHAARVIGRQLEEVLQAALRII